MAVLRTFGQLAGPAKYHSVDALGVPSNVGGAALSRRTAWSSPAAWADTDAGTNRGTS